MSFAAKSVLVKLSISAWSNRKLDNRGTETVANTFSAETIDDKYTKALVPKSALKDIDRVVAAARTTHYKYTLPWANNAVRLLPTALYFTYQEKMSAHKSVFEELVNQFITRYPQWIDYAERTKGDLFNRNEYIPPEQLAQRYAMTIDFMPFPEKGDFRIDLSKEDIEALRTEFEISTKREMEKTTAHVKNLVHNKLKDLREIATTAKTFRDATMQFADFIQIIRGLNVACDDSIEYSCKRLENFNYSPTVIRDSYDIRQDIVKMVGECLDELLGH